MNPSCVGVFTFISYMEIWTFTCFFASCIKYAKETEASKCENWHHYDRLKASFFYQCNLGPACIYTNVLWILVYHQFIKVHVSWTWRLLCNSFCVMAYQSTQESAEIQDELKEKVDRLKAELVVFKSLMSDVSVQHTGDVINTCSSLTKLSF